MQSIDLQACLGFLQAIYFSAKVANVNKEVCQSFSRIVCRIRPCLEEVDMAEPDDGEQDNSSLRMIETSLENIHVAIGRFSTMGYLQSMIEAQALCDNFSKSRDNLIEALEKLATSRVKCSTQDWVDDIRRVCDLLKGLRFEDCEHSKIARDVHSTSRKIINGDISEKSGFVLIRSRLLAKRHSRPYNMQEEIQGLERELSRARVEKKQHEIEELNTIIRALKQSSPDLDQDSLPQPPVEYLCPISHNIMKDPVVLVETGQTYDRKYIEEWFNRGNRTCPATKQTVTELNLTPNYALKSLASSWLDVNTVGDDGEDEESVIFSHSGENVIDNDNKVEQESEVKPNTVSCMDGGGYNMMIECGYSALADPDVSQALKSSTASSVDSTSLIPKKGIESCGASRESYSGKNQLYSPDKEDLPEHKTKPQPAAHVHKQAMQTANVVNPLATPTPSSPSLNFGGLRGDGGRHGASALSIPALANKKVFAARANAKAAEIAETRSTDHYEASTPRSSYSELPGHSCAHISLSNAVQTLEAARRLKHSVDGEENTPRSARPASRVLFRADGKASSFSKRPPSNLSRQKNHYGPPSVCSGTSRASRVDREAEYRQYDDLDKIGSESEAGTDQQATDEVEEDWHDSPGFEVASLTTIGSTAQKYAGSVMSMRPAKKGVTTMCTGFMQGATNVLFGAQKVHDIDGDSSIAEEEEDTNDVSLPVLANLLKTNDSEFAASLASELAIKAQTDPGCLQDIPRMDIIPSLINLLSLPSDAAKAAAARALGVIGERSLEANAQILNHGAIPILSRLSKEAEAKNCCEVEEGSMEDVAGATRFALSALVTHTREGLSVDVSPQMLVELLNSSDEDLQASAVLDLLEKLDTGYAQIVLKELGEQSAVLSLVDMLEHSEQDVQFGAAEILSKMIFHDQKIQQHLSQSVGIIAKLLRLIKQGGTGSTSCKSAAAQVIRGLAHNNSKIREDVLKRGVIPEFASLLMCNDLQSRETAAWMLGIMASHSENGQDEVVSCDQAMFMLGELAENGAAQERVAAKFALRAISSEVGCDDNDVLSVPLVIQALKIGSKSVKIAAAWELCRMANNNQWSQIEIYECGGVSALLGYLSARPGPDGIQACLSTLVKLASNEARVAAQIVQENGLALVVRLLSAPSVTDKKQLIQLLTSLAEKCPTQQQQLVSEGAVPVLVDLLYSDESICHEASHALGCLIENDMSVIAVTVTERATPTLLDLASSEDCPSFSRKAGIQLLGKMGEATYDCQQIVVQQGALEILMQTVQNGDDPDICIAATKAVTSLSKKDFRDRRNGNTIPRLVQILETSASQRKSSTPGLIKMGDPTPQPPMPSGNGYIPLNRASSVDSASTHVPPSHTQAQLARMPSRKVSMAGSMALPVVQELSDKEETESETESDETQSTSIQEAPESPLSRTTFEQVPKRASFEVFRNELSLDGQESVHADSEYKSQCGFAPSDICSSRAPSVVVMKPMIPPSEPVAQLPPKPVSTKKIQREINQFVETLREDSSRQLPPIRATSEKVSELRKMALSDPRIKTNLLKSGALTLMVDRLMPFSKGH